LPPPPLSDVRILQLVPRNSSTPSGVQLYRLILPGSQPSDGNSDTFPPYFVDTGGVVGALASWLDTVRNNFNAQHSYFSPAEAGTPALFVHGFIKSGKSLVLGGVLPAVLRQHPFFGVGSPAEMLHCALDFNIITSHGTVSYQERLSTLLESLRTWAGCVAPASNIGLTDDIVRLQTGILEFFKKLGRPVLYTVDEAWFLLPADSGRLDQARSFLKTMLCCMPRNAAIAVTGSSMCLVWSNVAVMPPNGVALATHNRTLTLPAESYEGAAVAWDFLHQNSHIALPDQLHMSRDFGMVLRQLIQADRKLLYDLACSDGVRVRSIDGGLWLMLWPLLTRASSGALRYTLTSSYHCRLIKLLVTEDGAMQPMLTYRDSRPPIVILEARMGLLRFGNMVVDAWQQDFKEAPVLQKFLQVLHVYGEGWSAMPPWKKVALYHWLLHNALAHEGQDEHEYEIQEGTLEEDMDALGVTGLILAYPFAVPNQIPELLRGVRAVSSGGGLVGAELGVVVKGTLPPPGGPSRGSSMVPRALPLGHSSKGLPRASSLSMPAGGRQVHALHHRVVPASRMALQRAVSSLPRIKLV
ncbi:hypothetical protein TSOC_006908, partial [Tetrabaena socialis]